MLSKLSLQDVSGPDEESGLPCAARGAHPRGVAVAPGRLHCEGRPGSVRWPLPLRLQDVP